MATVLVCDDESDICKMLDVALRREGHRVETVTSGEVAIRKLESSLFDVLITDMKMPGVNGLEVLRAAATTCPDAERIVITAHEDFETARRVAESGGVFHYFVKGSSNLPLQVAHAVRQAMEKLSLKRQNLAFKRDAAQHNSLDNLVGSSAPVQKLKQTIQTVAGTGSTILIRGESGTGKELVARAVHGCSPRNGDPFVSINCGAFPETLLESELFGYMKGAFTGANQNKRGLFEVANNGTIFLDEISEMTPTMQVKLLRVLQERVIRPVGGTSENPIDVRVIAATNKNLEDMITAGDFREDLYYRISVIPIYVPPLRDRGEDIKILACHFLKKFAAAMGKPIHHFDPEALDLLKAYDWPGNVRQLENTIERCVAMEMGEELHVDLPSEGAKSVRPNGITIPREGVDFDAYVSGVEKSLIQSALRRENNVQTHAANLLKLSYRSFRHLLKKHNIDPETAAVRSVGAGRF